MAGTCGIQLTTVYSAMVEWASAGIRYCQVISCTLAQRSVQRGAAEVSGIGEVQRVFVCGHGNAVGLTSILDRGQFFLIASDFWP